jgi:hypothetical protein
MERETKTFKIGIKLRVIAITSEKTSYLVVLS